MSRRVTIVMYHFVRDLARSRFPQIKGLSTGDFCGQLDFLGRHYQVVSADDVIRAARGEDDLPDRALLLTFDDGYADHFDVVLPMLEERRWPGCFFPPAQAVLESRVLDVNKIHFILAAASDPKEIVAAVFEAVAREGPARRLPAPEAYWSQVAHPGRYDSAEIIFVKRMLQRELPADLRTSVTDALFRKFVTQDENGFAAELYMSLEQLRTMHRSGMCVGSHGYNHSWLNALNAEQQRAEIERSLSFLDQVGVASHDWVMCYPYGAWNATLLEMLPAYGCALGLTVEVAVADLGVHQPLTLPRLDTNDLPTRATANGSGWLHRA